MNSLITMDQDSSITRYQAITISGYTDIKYPYNKSLSYFITGYLNSYVS
jgi:hypothetical protein